MEHVLKILKAAQDLVSLDLPRHEDQDRDLLDVIEGHSAFAPYEIASHLALRELIEELLEQLTERERAVLSLRYGLFDGHSRTLSEVGQTFHLTRERIRQIEARALEKLRTQSLGEELMDSLDS